MGWSRGDSSHALCRTCWRQITFSCPGYSEQRSPHGLTQGPLKGGYNGTFYDSPEVLFKDDDGTASRRISSSIRSTRRTTDPIEMASFAAGSTASS